ncbi:hypothetical protein ACFQ61_06095 [Streptomyces sp. NPDC056500]|uniref:hypothetical protein n=1 Tax=Streptomyces sp. NPDC056500 TaxID=3345840 RepID=UPI003682AA17
MDQQQPCPEPSDTQPIVCARCGRTAEGEGAPATWTYSMEHGSRRYYCDDCARAHIRSIESRLDSNWW